MRVEPLRGCLRDEADLDSCGSLSEASRTVGLKGKGVQEMVCLSVAEVVRARVW